MIEEKKNRNIVTPVCIIISIAAIFLTAANGYSKKWYSSKAAADMYAGKQEETESGTLSLQKFEWQTADAGEAFIIGRREVIVKSAAAPDDAMLTDVPAGEKLVMVSVEVRLLKDQEYQQTVTEKKPEAETASYEPPADWDYFWDHSGLVYASDGVSCNLPLDGESVMRMAGDGGSFGEAFSEEDILTGSGFIDCTEEGQTGEFFFLTDEKAEEVRISFSDGEYACGPYILEKRVSVPLRIEEGGV